MRKGKQIMHRRQFCRRLAALSIGGAIPLRASAAAPLRVAWVSTERRNPDSPILRAFREGLHELGYTDRQGLVIDTWWGDGSDKRLAEQVGAIVAAKPDVILAQGGAALTAMLRSGVTIPIVFSVSSDPVEAKFVDSYAKPGVNRTGISVFTLALVGKRMELLLELIPGMKRVAVIANPQHPGEGKELEAARAAAAKLGLQVRYFPARSEAELEAALADIARARDEAVIVFADGFMMGFAPRIAAFSLQHRIPTVDGWAPFARAGNLLIYGPVFEDVYRRLAVYVDKIHKGARAAELPVELPTKVELVINAKTAKALGLTVPQSLLLRADEIIQ